VGGDRYSSTGLFGARGRGGGGGGLGLISTCQTKMKGALLSLMEGMKRAMWLVGSLHQYSVVVQQQTVTLWRSFGKQDEKGKWKRISALAGPLNKMRRQINRVLMCF